MKKLLNVLMYLSMLLVILSISVSANSGTLIEKIEITTTYPIIGTSTKIGSSDIKISDPDVIIVEARWEDQHGNYVEKFKADQFYQCYMRIEAKSGSGKYIDPDKTVITINGLETECYKTNKNLADITVITKEVQRSMNAESQNDDTAQHSTDYQKDFTPEPYKVWMGVNKLMPEVSFPVAGQMPEEPEFSSYACDLMDYEWQGSFDANGCFMAGQTYKLVMDFRIKATESKDTRFIYQSGELVSYSRVTDKNNSKNKACIQIVEKSDKAITVETEFYADGTALRIDAFGRKVPHGEESPTLAYSAIKEIKLALDEPIAYEKITKDASVIGPDDMVDKIEVVDVLWYRYGGKQATEKTFVDGLSYSANVVIHIKSTDYKLYFEAQNVRLNGGQMVEVSDDRQYAVISYSFGPARSQALKEIIAKEEQERLEERENNRKGTPVDKLEPGDSGSFRFTGSVYFLDYPKEYHDPKIGSSTAIAGHWDEIEVVEAYIPSINRENQFYHAVKEPDSGTVKYVLVKEDKFFSYRKTSSNASRPYAKKWESQIKIGDPIEKVMTHLLDFSDGKPRYTYTDSKDEKFYTEKVVYEHPDGVKPFTYTTAVVTYKAKDGYYFDKKLTKLNEYRIQAEHTTGFKIIDNKTMEVYLTAFTWNMGHDVSVTDEMIAFNEKVKNMHLIPMASASDLYFPLFNHWDLKLQARDFEFNEVHVTNFQEKNMRRIYSLPTTAAIATEYPRHFTLTTIEIADDDLSDDIPGLVGEWCLLTDGRYIPRSCLKDFKYETMFEGAPAKFVVSPFEFAGGSGTLEDPFLIENAQQLNAVRQGPKYHYKLIADIDLSTWGNWVPIGGTPAYGLNNGKAAEYVHAFLGSFDGNGHVISGMQIVVNEETPFMGSMTGDWRAYGLFANIGSNPKEYKIKNLGVVDFNIDITYTNLKKELRAYVGAIVGGMNMGADIYNCYSVGGRININLTPNAKAASSEITGANPDGPPRVVLYVGGICAEGGSANHRMHIEKCFNDSNINVTLNGLESNIYAAGIIGSMDTTHVHECYNSGNITLPVGIEDLQGNWSDAVAAGICGYAAIPEIPGIYHTNTEGSSFIQNCYNSGNITGRSAFGIFGFSASDIHLENCYNVGQITGNDFDQSHGYSTIHPILSQSCGIIPYGTEYVRNCTANGNAVTGSMWKSSASLGRKVLVSVPEDNPPSSSYSFTPTIVGAFTDVLSDAWYAEPVKWAVDKSITNGTSATTFSPDNTCTRAQILTFLWRAVGSPQMTGANPFSDVNTTDYYYNAALWASSKGLIGGTKFSPNTPCTRAETVVYLWKNAGCPAAEQVNQFLDIKDINSELGKAVSWAFMNSITGGTASHAFSPDMTCTRGQIVTFLYRALK